MNSVKYSFLPRSDVFYDICAKLLYVFSKIPYNAILGIALKYWPSPDNEDSVRVLLYLSNV